jgi:hypothetical protein
MLINNSIAFTFLTTHLHERGGFNGDAETLGALSNDLETIAALDMASQLFHKNP